MPIVLSAPAEQHFSEFIVSYAIARGIAMESEEIQNLKFALALLWDQQLLGEMPTDVAMMIAILPVYARHNRETQGFVPTDWLFPWLQANFRHMVFCRPGPLRSAQQYQVIYVQFLHAPKFANFNLQVLNFQPEAA